jgi:predicted membrane-bound mannosyltransferase
VWGGVLLLAGLSRFVDLGRRAMSHDESLHAFLAFKLYQVGSYRHDPATHGPLLQHLNAAVFWLIGASDATARLVPALAGVGLVAVLWGFRRYLGRAGALLAALLVVISPSLTFYSRYLRNDLSICLFSLVWAYGLLRYLEERRPRWLALVTLAMAASFLSKEVAFIFGAIAGAFCAGLFLWRRLHGRERWRESAPGDLAVLMLTLVLPFGGCAGVVLLGGDPYHYTTRADQVHDGAAVIFLVGLSVLTARLWFGPGPGFRGWARLMSGFWGLQALFFTTLFTNVPVGLATGIVGSLAYWLRQQPVRRGGQPWFYYPLLAGLYEFLPALLAVAAAVEVIRRRARAEPGGEIPGALPGRDVPLAFCLWWAVAGWIAYSAAGEKMPWLLVHLVLPLCLLGGSWLARLLRSIDWRGIGARRAIALTLGAPVLVVIAAHAARVPPVAGRELIALEEMPRWMASVLLTTTLAILGVGLLRVVGRHAGGRLVAVGLIAGAALLTVRTTVRLAYVNYDLPIELLVYAHGTPDIKRAMAEIDLIAQRTGRERTLEVAVDDESSWPLAWYLRDYPGMRAYGSDPTPDAMAAPVVIVGPRNAAKVAPFVERGYLKRRYRLIWWPLQGYQKLSWAELGRTLRDPAARAWLWEVISERRYPGLELAEWPLRREFHMYISREAAAGVWLFGPRPPDAEPRPDRGARAGRD